jgi:hypothetical protein
VDPSTSSLSRPLPDLSCFFDSVCADLVIDDVETHLIATTEETVKTFRKGGND